MYKTFLSSAIFSLVLLVSACKGDQRPINERDSPTTGKIEVFAEDGYQPFLSTSIAVFQSDYPLATANATYMSEHDAVKGLIEKTALVAIISRKLTDTELIPFTNRGFTPETHLLAYDGVAFIVHPSNVDSIFTREEIRRIMTGNARKWSDLNAKNKSGDINIVFDNQGSGTVRYVVDSICAGDFLTQRVSALQTNQEVIAYVAKAKNAIGIISANWISDTDDKGSQKFLTDITLCGIAKETGAEAFTPYQAYLATGDYPFKRAAYIINAQPKAFGLGRGFTSFMVGPKGQRIAHKEGLLPATMPVRLMKIEKE